MRYFLGVYDAAGYLHKLSKGLKENEKSVRYLNLAIDQYSYSDSTNYWLARKIENFALSSTRKGVRRKILTLVVGLTRTLILLNELPRSDVFIFSGFQGFMNFYELPILRFFKKTVIVIYLGSDARPPYLSGKHLDDNKGIFQSKNVLLEAKKLKSRINRVEKWATHIVNHPGTSQFFTKRSIFFSYLGIPFNQEQLVKPATCKVDSTTIRILHAPSRPVAKGSDVFRSAVASLKLEGFDIELIELKNKSNKQVLEEIHLCDLVLDELYSDMPLATFGVEASLFKKPLIVGGYFSQIISNVLPNDLIPPTLFIHPDNIEITLRDLLSRRDEWATIGEKQWKYVFKNYTSSEVARKIETIASGLIPENQLYDPQDVTYVHGWGLSESNMKQQLCSYIDELGDDALLLDTKVILRDRLLRFIGKISSEN